LFLRRRDTGRAMSQENVEAVRASFELWRDGRMGEWIETLDADIEWDISAHPLPDFPDRGRGRDAFVGHMGDYLSGWTAYEVSGKELIDRGEDVVLIIRERARMPDSDMMLDRDLPSVWTVRDGRAVRLRVFKTRTEAFEATVLSE
jgi:ketosteroid isomerase-like protein